MMMLELVRLLRTSKWKYLIFIIIVSIAYKQLIYTETGTSMGIAQLIPIMPCLLPYCRHFSVFICYMILLIKKKRLVHGKVYCLAERLLENVSCRKS